MLAWTYSAPTSSIGEIAEKSSILIGLILILISSILTRMLWSFRLGSLRQVICPNKHVKPQNCQIWMEHHPQNQKIIPENSQ